MQEKTWESSHGNGPNGRQEGVLSGDVRERRGEGRMMRIIYLFIYFNMGNGDG
jgi:hypothetical protein